MLPVTHSPTRPGESQRLVASALDEDATSTNEEVVIAPRPSKKKKAPEPVVQLCVKRKRTKDKKKKKKKKKKKRQADPKPVSVRILVNSGEISLTTSIDFNQMVAASSLLSGYASSGSES